MSIVELSQIQALASMGSILWTEHVAIRIRERGIKRADVIECINNGDIIEQYPTDMPFPSCLILGRCKADNPLHIVVGVNWGVHCCVITAYRPDMERWENDLKTRKRKKT